MRIASQPPVSAVDVKQAELWEGREETKGNNLKNNDTWMRVAKDQTRWKEIEKDYTRNKAERC